MSPGCADARSAPGRRVRRPGINLAPASLMSEEIWLSCRDLERWLGEEDDSRVHALRGVSLDLEPGSVHAVVGPSGCGKSTLLYVLGLLDQPDGGTLTIDGHVMARPARR